MLTGFFDLLGDVVHTILGGLDAINQIFAPSPPEIPQYTKNKMIEYGIGYKELMQAYHSKRTEPGYKPGSVCGVYFNRNLAVGAIYIRDQKDPKKYVIIGCWSRPISDYYRRFGNVSNQYSKN
jgi:hypothetical protein